VNYTWSKSIDNATTSGGGFEYYQIDNFNLRLNRARSDFDRPHVLTALGPYTLPVAVMSARSRGAVMVCIGSAPNKPPDSPRLPPARLAIRDATHFEGPVYSIPMSLFRSVSG
jgi:hypothetical protein